MSKDAPRLKHPTQLEKDILALEEQKAGIFSLKRAWRVYEERYFTILHAIIHGGGGSITGVTIDHRIRAFIALGNRCNGYPKQEIGGELTLADLFARVKRARQSSGGDGTK